MLFVYRPHKMLPGPNIATGFSPDEVKINQQKHLTCLINFHLESLLIHFLAWVLSLQKHNCFCRYGINLSFVLCERGKIIGEFPMRM